MDRDTRALRLGNLVLTNRRLIFLHKIESSPEVKENIRKLADAPIETVLNYAYTLNKNNFQIPLSNIIGLKIGAYNWTPIPHVCLSIIYVDRKYLTNRMASFQFIRPYKQTILKPQFMLRHRLDTGQSNRPLKPPIPQNKPTISYNYLHRHSPAIKFFEIFC